MREANHELIELIKQRVSGGRDKNIRFKVNLFLLALKLENVTEACLRMAVSREFYHKWWSRFKRSKFSVQSLKEMSRRPVKSPRRIGKSLERRIKVFASRGFGALLIQAYLSRDQVVLSLSCISKVIRGRRVKVQREKRFKKHTKRYELDIPGQRIQLDVKYVPKMIDGRRAYNYVAIDECTRLRVAKSYTSLNEHSTRDFLEYLKESLPFKIYQVQTDNGFEFTYKLMPHQPKSKHLMQIWCENNEIKHRTIPPGVKELNGKVERSHRIDEEFFFRTDHPTSFISFQAAYDKWLRYYNNVKPHGGLKMMTPHQKLIERMHSLQNLCFIDSRLEKMRLEFLRELPSNYKTNHFLLEELEARLLALKHSA